MINIFASLRIPSLCLFAAVVLTPFVGNAQSFTLTNGVASYSSLTNGSVVTLTGRCELRVTSATPFTGCIINLNSADTCLVLPGVRPSAVNSTYLTQIRINGAGAVSGSNCRVVQYSMGAIVLPHSSSFQPLTVFSGPNFTGSSLSLSQWVYHTSGLGVFYGNISSFKLKRGYMATFAQNESGTGLSKCYIAQDGDMEVSVLPANFDNSVRRIYVMPWRWTAKKGVAGGDGSDQLTGKWWYNWNISSSSSSDVEYVAIRQQPYWPGLGQNWQSLGINTVLNYNEPDNSVEDAYQNLTPPGSISDAVARMPDVLGTGLRIGSPAPTDGGYSSWLYPFMTQVDAAGLRVDFVAVHYYRCVNPADPNAAASQLYNALKGIYDTTKRPLWVTEWNNGANWTGCGDPTFAQQDAAIGAMIAMLDNAPFVERYSIYGAVEEVRQMYYNAGGLTPAGATYGAQQSPVGYVQALQDNGTRSWAQLLCETNALDTSGYGNNGITTGSPSYTNGHTGKALVFDGTNTVVTLPPNVANGSSFTFAAWVNWGGGNAWQRIFDFGNSDTHYLFLSPNSSGTMRFAIKNGGAEQVVDTAGIPANQWRHVAVTLSGNTAQIYTNGVLAAQNTSMSITPASFAPRVNRLGKSSYVADPMFKGMLDDVLITDTALSAAQIASLQTNLPPQFTNAVLVRAVANVNQPYSDTLAGSAIDPNASDTLTFSKATGPAWLTVAANGTLGGTPGLTDGGTNSFTVRVTDAAGMSAFATMSIVVNSAATLVARYEFDNNTLSSVGTLHGVMTGPATYVAGHLGQAIDLNGTTNFVTLPAGVASSDDITVATWVNWDGGGAWQRIFDFGNGTAQNILLTPSSGSGTMRFVIKNGTEQILDATALPVGVWRHVVVTLSGNVGRIYVNGVQVAVSAAMSFNPSDFDPTINYIGKSQYPDPLFNGRIDGFHIYNYALSAAQIASLYTSQPPAFTLDPISRPNATTNVLYSASIAGTATDPESATLTYSKSGGPGWLKVAANGVLSGVPGPANVGLNTFYVRATDTVPISDEAALNIFVPPGADAVGLYSFESSTTNSTGANHGTASGSPSYTNGYFGLAIRLDGTNQFVTLPAGMMNVADITIAARVHWNGGAIWQRIFDFGNNTSQYMFLSPRSAGNTLRFCITTNGNAGEQFVETTQLTSNQWVHVTAVLQGNGGKIYVDGALAASNSMTINPNNFNPAVNYLGKSQWPDALFGGRLDDVRIYNRALSDFEIANIANPSLDSDNDGLSDSAEGIADSDGDTIPNYLDTDSDNDGMSDGAEGFADTDGDSIPNLRDTDSDNDAMPDSWEFTYGLSPTNAADASLDLDGDGSSNTAEYIAATAPNDANDYFHQTVDASNPFAVSIAGKAGRTYKLFRAATPDALPGQWTEVATSGSLPSNQLVILTDPGQPAITAFYRATVSAP